MNYKSQSSVGKSNLMQKTLSHLQAKLMIYGCFTVMHKQFSLQENVSSLCCNRFEGIQNCLDVSSANFQDVFPSHFSPGVTSYGVPTGEKEIMAEIYKNGPVEAAFLVYSDFLMYKSGEPFRIVS